MDKKELLAALLDFFLNEPDAPVFKRPESYRAGRETLHALWDVRPPRPVPEHILRLQDELLLMEREERSVTDAKSLPSAAEAFSCKLPAADNMALWRGDITTLRADAIVNAANSRMLGCFQALHSCIDNVIHAAAGLRLRLACNEMMLAEHPNGEWEEPSGRARITPGFNLPARYVLHTVGPIVEGSLKPEHERLLASCYNSCLELGAKNGCASLAFCCISTGVFRFPAERAAEIAVASVADFLQNNPSTYQLVIFNVFSERDHALYQRLLSE